MVRQVAVRTTLKGAQEFRAGIDSIRRGFGSLGSSIDSIGQRMTRVGRTMTSVGNKLSIGLTAPLTLAGGAVIKMAADAAESENLFEVSMGGMADEARTFSETLRDQFGLNSFETRKQIATFNQMTTAMGVSEGAAFQLSKGLTVLTNDMASFFNLSPDEAFTKITAAISGEVEPLKRLGIIVNETTIKQTAMREGLVRQGETFSEAQKVMLRYLTILDQTENAQGDLARTMDSPTNRMRIFKARLQETGITIGNILIPFMNVFLAISLAIVKPIEAMINRFNELSPVMRGVVLASIGLIAAVGPLLSIFGRLLIIVPRVVAALRLAIPVAVVLSAKILAVAAAAVTFAASTIAIVRSLPQFASSVRNVFEGILSTIEKIGLTIKISVTEAIADISESMAELVEDRFPAMAARFDLAASSIRLSNRKTQIEIERLGQSASDSFDKAGKDIVDSGKTFVDTFIQLPGKVVEQVKTLFEGVIPDITGMLEGLGGASSATTEEVKSMMEETREAVLQAIKDSEGIVKASKGAAERIRKQQEAEIAAFEKATEDKERLANREFEFLVKTGQRTLEEFIERKNTELGIHIAIMNSKLQASQEEHEKELELRQEITDLNKQLADERIEEIQNTTNITEEEAQKQLEIELAKFEAIGEAGALAAQRISEELGKMRDASKSATSGVIRDLTDIQFRGITVAQRMHSSMQSFFFGMIKGAETTKDLVSKFFTELADAILSEFARIAASSVFKAIFGGEGGGFDIGGLIQTGVRALIGAATFGGSEIALAGTSAASGAVAGGAVAGLTGFQTGGKMLVQKPTLFTAGEMGPEEVFVRPLGGSPARGDGSTVVFSGINIVDPISIVDFERKIEESISRGNRNIL